MSKKNAIKAEDEITTVRYFTRELFVECYEQGEKWGLNRQVNENVKKLPKKDKFPVIRTLPHFHAAGVRVEEHVRCVVEVDENIIIVDVPVAFYEKLPVALIIEEMQARQERAMRSARAKQAWVTRRERAKGVSAFKQAGPRPESA